MVKYKFAKAQSLTMFSFDFFKQTVRKHIYCLTFWFSNPQQIKPSYITLFKVFCSHKCTIQANYNPKLIKTCITILKHFIVGKQNDHLCLINSGSSLNLHFLNPNQVVLLFRIWPKYEEQAHSLIEKALKF